MVTEEEFDTLDQDKLQYNYSWIYDEKPQDRKRRKECFRRSDGRRWEKLSHWKLLFRSIRIRQLLFTGDDMGSDKAMMIMLLYIIIVIMAFVFGITTSNTIRERSRRHRNTPGIRLYQRELVRHYMTLPVIVTLIGALIGNILGYTVFKDVCAGYVLWKLQSSDLCDDLECRSISSDNCGSGSHYVCGQLCNPSS